MKWFILKEGPDKNGQVSLTGADYRRLVKVLRLAPGEFFPALLPCGNEVLVRVCSVDRNILTVEIAGAVSHGKRLMPPIILFQALPKGDKMDLIVRQAAECGLEEIVPFVSEFSVAKTAGAKGGQAAPRAAGQKFSRWERIIREARQQSGSAVRTTVRESLSADEMFAYWEQIKTERPGSVGLLFHHLPLANETLHGYLGKSRPSGEPVNGPHAVVLAVGPEGGFSQIETDRFLTAGFRPFTFEGPVLRTETAALYAAAAVQILLTERESWEMK